MMMSLWLIFLFSMLCVGTQQCLYLQCTTAQWEAETSTVKQSEETRYSHFFDRPTIKMKHSETAMHSNHIGSWILSCSSIGVLFRTSSRGYRESNETNGVNAVNMMNTNKLTSINPKVTQNAVNPVNPTNAMQSSLVSKVPQKKQFSVQRVHI